VDLIIRESRPWDESGVLEAYRDSHNALRKSRGGSHPDDAVDEIIGRPDKVLSGKLLKDSIILVAEERVSGEIVGFSSFTYRWVDRLLGSAYLKATYVKERCQRGKAGVSVGRLLVEKRLEMARDKGFRKFYSFSVPESIGFQKKIGMKLYPEHNIPTFWDSELHYCELELRPSFWNRFTIEPYCAKIWKSLSSLIKKG
jgi:ribosomal protein S18 acetylase RimI-like enzyme